MSRIELKDVSMVYPFQEVNGLFGRKKKQEQNYSSSSLTSMRILRIQSQ